MIFNHLLRKGGKVRFDAGAGNQLWHLAHYPQGTGGSTGGFSSLELFSNSSRKSPPPSGRPATGAGVDYHIPVMLEEVVHFLAPSRGKLFLDCTLGGGGHTRRLLEEGANVIGLDQDSDALNFARERLAEFGDSFSAIHANFSDYGELLGTVGFRSGLDGILLDLGVSSRQLENAERGFSFQVDGPLDMRMNPSGELTAEVVVNEWEEGELVSIFREFGEEKAARRIAASIVKVRRQQAITTTLQLADLVESVLPRRGRQHPATRVFQAIRIAVNDEFGALKIALEEAHRWLRPGGRLVVVTFHSLEDRIVKQFMRHQCMEWIDRPEYPEPKPNPECYFDAVIRKPMSPSKEEVAENPRARSAKLRVVERRMPMRKQQNKYRNRLGPTATSYMVLVGIIAAITGSAFVFVKNQHMVKEDRKRDLEKEIAALNTESEQLQLKVQIQLGQHSIFRRLGKFRSQLDKIPPGAVTTISPAYIDWDKETPQMEADE